MATVTPASVATQIHPLHVDSKKESWTKGLQIASRVPDETRVALARIVRS